MICRKYGNMILCDMDNKYLVQIGNLYKLEFNDLKSANNLFDLLVAGKIIKEKELTYDTDIKK